MGEKMNKASEANLDSIPVKVKALFKRIEELSGEIVNNGHTWEEKSKALESLHNWRNEIENSLADSFVKILDVDSKLTELREELGK